MLQQQRLDFLGECRIGQHQRRDVDGNDTARVMAAPAPTGSERIGQNAPCERHDQATLLSQGDENIRPDRSTRCMTPACERFKTNDLSAVQSDLRLEGRHDQIVVECFAQLLDRRRCRTGMAGSDPRRQGVRQKCAECGEADRLCQRPGDPQAKLGGIPDAGRTHSVVQTRDENHHRIGRVRRDQAEQADPFPLAERQVQNDDIVDMLGDAVARLLQRACAVGGKAERRHCTCDDQALDGFVIDDQETTNGVDMRVHVFSRAALNWPAIVAKRDEESREATGVDTARCNPVF